MVCEWWTDYKHIIVYYVHKWVMYNQPLHLSCYFMAFDLIKMCWIYRCTWLTLADVFAQNIDVIVCKCMMSGDDDKLTNNMRSNERSLHIYCYCMFNVNPMTKWNASHVLQRCLPFLSEPEPIEPRDQTQHRLFHL